MDEVEKDDQQTGRILTRREVIAILGAAAAGTGIIGSAGREASGGVSVPGCIGRPEQTEGPYYLDAKLNRSDIRSEPTDGSLSGGAPLFLEFKVLQVTPQGCVPLPGAIVDVWHCDAHGIYSGVLDPRFDTRGKKFLRGYQGTDNAGIARFQTIYPGWYPGRTVHMHLKIRKGARSEFTSQLYFDDSMTDLVYQQEPYAGRGRRAMRNGDDFLFRAGGERLILPVTKEGNGFRAVFEIGLE